MTTRRSFVRAAEETRRADLIEATLDLIAEGGPQAATVRAIALRAGVTPGLIRHYFATKEDLVAAAHQALMGSLTEATLARIEALPDNPPARLAEFVSATVSPPIADARGVSLWAAMLQGVARDPQLHRMHRATYLDLRNHLEAMIRQALIHAGRPADDSQALAIAANALLDGLWIEAGALPDEFQPDQLKNIGIKALSRLLQIELPEV